MLAARARGERERPVVGRGHHVDRGAHDGRLDDGPVLQRPGQLRPVEVLEPGPQADVARWGVLRLQAGDRFERIGQRTTGPLEEELPAEHGAVEPSLIEDGVGHVPQRSRAAAPRQVIGRRAPSSGRPRGSRGRAGARSAAQEAAAVAAAQRPRCRAAGARGGWPCARGQRFQGPRRDRKPRPGRRPHRGRPRRRWPPGGRASGRRTGAPRSGVSTTTATRAPWSAAGELRGPTDGPHRRAGSRRRGPRRGRSRAAAAAGDASPRAGPRRAARRAAGPARAAR